MVNTGSNWVIEVNEGSFTREVLERSRQVPVVVAFTAGWCGPCQVLGPILERLAQEYQGRFILAKIDFDRNPYLTMELGIRSIPAVFAFRDGRVAGHFVGALPEAEVRDFIERILPSLTEQAFKQARELIDSQPEEALRLLDLAAQERPDSEDIAALRARALLRLGRGDEARRLAEQVTEGSEWYQDAANVLAVLEFRERARQVGGVEGCRNRLQGNPKDLDARYDLGICLAAEGRYEEALPELLAVAEADRALGAGKVKDAMVKIFHLLGPESELANDYRSRLAAVIY